MATTPRDAVVYTLECGTDVVLVDITPTELIKAAKEVGASAESGVAGIKVTRAALCQSIVKVGAKAVNHAQRIQCPHYVGTNIAAVLCPVALLHRLKVPYGVTVHCGPPHSTAVCPETEYPPYTPL